MKVPRLDEWRSGKRIPSRPGNAAELSGKEIIGLSTAQWLPFSIHIICDGWMANVIMITGNENRRIYKWISFKMY